MFKAVNAKLYIVCILVAALSLTVFSASMVTGQADSFQTVKEKISGISVEERENLKNLFTIVQEIEGMEKEEEEIARDVEGTKRETENLQASIADEEKAYSKKREDLKQVLRSYQRMGPGSYLEIILDSDSLPTLLRRINILRDLTQNTGKLLESLNKSKEKQSEEKAKLAEKLLSIQEKQEQFKKSLAQKTQLKDDEEKYLASLTEKRKDYQEYLDNIQQVWDELKPLFSKASRYLSGIIKEGSLSPDAVKITYSLFNARTTINENVLNDIITEHPQLPKMVFSFYPDKVEINLPEKDLVLTGKFVILDGHSLKFEVEEGSFYGMPLESKAIEELFGEGYLIVDLKPLIGSNTLNSVKTTDGDLELGITLKY